MKSPNSLCLFLVFFAYLLSFSHAHKNFSVGGKDGWVLEPKEKYNDWAGKQRFQVNDTLIFKFEKGSDSVLLVHKDDYYNCNITNPVKKMTSGSSEFQFNQSGPFYFISGKEGHCQKGQKLITVVMVARNGTPSTHPPHAPTPKSPVPVTEPPAKSPFLSPGPAHSPEHYGPVAKPPKASSPVPAPSTHYSPSSGPSYSPMVHGPIAYPPKATSPSTGPSYSPMAYGPIAYPPKAISPSTALSPNSPTPFSSPQISPSPYSTSPQASTPSPSNAPVETPTPASTISSPPAPPQGTSPSPSSSPSSSTGSKAPSGRQTGTPGPSPSPKSSKSSAAASYSSLMVLVSSVLLSIVFASFVGGF